MTALAPVYEPVNEATIKDYIVLLKPRVMSLVVFTALCALLMAPGKLHPALALIAIICIAGGAGAAGCLNMWWDRDMDALMARTKNRPLPQGKIDPDTALALGIITSFGSVILLGLAIHWLAAGLLGVTIFFYICVYTMILKRRTPQNIVIGGAAGALPPVIGWACVTGNLSLEPFILFSIIFLWTPPHFWALCLYNCQDYKNAHVPMMPATAGVAATGRQIIIYSVLMVITSMVPLMVGMAGWIYGCFAVILGGGFVVLAFRVNWLDKPKISLQLFAYSLFYLFALFLVMTLDRLYESGCM